MKINSICDSGELKINEDNTKYEFKIKYTPESISPEFDLNKWTEFMEKSIFAAFQIPSVEFKRNIQRLNAPWKDII